MTLRSESLLSRVFAQTVQWLRKFRSAALVAGLIASVTALAVLSWKLYEVGRDNSVISALKAGDDIAVDARTASDEVLVARSAFLLARNRREEAQSLLDQSSGMTDPKLRARLIYNHANARVRDAIAAVERGNNDKAIPLTRLAKDEYRLALRLDPTAWDTKFNYDVAMRIVRDFPGYESEDEEPPPDAPTKLWTDLPGVPKGLP
jgi:mxaK protein